MPPEPAPSRAREGRARLILPPLLAFVAVNLLLWLAAWGDGEPFFDPETWSHWDSFHYIDIALDGYDYYECLRPQLRDPVSWFETVGAMLGFDVERPWICGDAGWYPGYPALMKLVSFTGLGLGGAGVLVAVAFQIATLVAIWRWFLAKLPPTTSVPILAAAAFFFGHVYFRAVFPMSLVTFLVLLHLHLLRSDRWVWAGVVGALAAFSYPTAFLLAPVAALWFLTARFDLSRTRRLAGAAWIAVPTMVGLGSVLVFQWIQTDLWGVFYKAQAHFGYGLSVPFSRFFEVVSDALEGGIAFDDIGKLQTVFVAVTVVSVMVPVVPQWADLAGYERWVVIFTLVFWIFPMTLGGSTSLYRIESVLLPVVLLLPRCPWPMRVVLPVVGIAFSYPMALLFFRGILV